MATSILIAISLLLAATVLQVSTQENGECLQRNTRDFRPVPGSCSKFQMCSYGTLITFACPEGSVFHEPSGSCVPEGSQYDTCTRPSRNLQPTACPRGATYKKAHPQHCARFFDCGKPAMDMHWENHEWECEYPMLFNKYTQRCEHYSMVSCEGREEPFDPCDYKANDCNGHTHCVPCRIRYPSCRGMQNGMNEWKGKPNSPFYVVCNKQRVVYSGVCAQEYGAQIFDSRLRICTSQKTEIRNFWWQ